MNIVTKFHGEQKIAENDILNFSSGIPGFDEEREFCLLPFEDTPLQVLQSINTKELAFITANPFDFFPDYSFQISQENIDALAIQSQNDVHVLTILTIREDFHESTANLQAPVVINRNNNQGKQCILNSTDYKTRHRLFTTQSPKGEEE